MTTALIVIACVVALFQPSRERFCIAVAYSVTCAIHLFLCDDLTGVLYYLSAGVFDLIVLLFICLRARPARFADIMVSVCAGSLVLNFYGWVIYEQYMEPISYNTASHVLYVFAIYVLLRRDWENDICYLDWLDIIRLPNRKRDRACHPLHKEAES